MFKNPDILTRKEVAQIIGCHVRFVLTLERRGELKRLNEGGWPKYSRTEVTILAAKRDKTRGGSSWSSKRIKDLEKRVYQMEQILAYVMLKTGSQLPAPIPKRQVEEMFLQVAKLRNVKSVSLLEVSNLTSFLTRVTAITLKHLEKTTISECPWADILVSSAQVKLILESWPLLDKDEEVQIIYSKLEAAIIAFSLQVDLFKKSF